MQRGILALKTFSEFSHIIAFGFMFLFTDYIEDPNIQYTYGGWFMSALVLTFAVHLAIIMGMILQKWGRLRHVLKID